MPLRVSRKRLLVRSFRHHAPENHGRDPGTPGPLGPGHVHDPGSYATGPTWARRGGPHLGPHLPGVANIINVNLNVYADPWQGSWVAPDLATLVVTFSKSSRAKIFHWHVILIRDLLIFRVKYA